MKDDNHALVFTLRFDSDDELVKAATELVKLPHRTNHCLVESTTSLATNTINVMVFYKSLCHEREAEGLVVEILSLATQN